MAAMLAAVEGSDGAAVPSVSRGLAAGAVLGVEEASGFAGVNRWSRWTGDVFVPVEDMDGEGCGGVSAVAMDMVAALIW